MSTKRSRSHHDLSLFEAKDQHIEVYTALKAKFGKMIGEIGYPNANSSSRLTSELFHQVAPSMASLCECFASHLHKLQDNEPAPHPDHAELKTPENPYAELEAVLKDIVPKERLDRTIAEEKGWKDFVVFHYLSEIADAYSAILVKADGRPGEKHSTVRTAFYAHGHSHLPGQVGMRFETQKFRHFLTEKDLEAREIEKFPGVRQVDPIVFYRTRYGSLHRQNVLNLNELRAYDAPLVKAIYRACEALKMEPETILPESRALVTDYNARGISRTAELTYRSHTHRRWRKDERQPL